METNMIELVLGIMIGLPIGWLIRELAMWGEQYFGGQDHY